MATAGIHYYLTKYRVHLQTLMIRKYKNNKCKYKLNNKKYSVIKATRYHMASIAARAHRKKTIQLFRGFRVS